MADVEVGVQAIETLAVEPTTYRLGDSSGKNKPPRHKP
jgi:hypothetical protein